MACLRVLWIVLVAVGCARSAAVVCGDGQVCAAGKRCDLVHEQCIFDAQATACLPATGLLDGDRCQAGELAGICDREVCLPGCGDGVQLEEECDDGNLVETDDCLNSCAWRVPTAHGVNGIGC